MPQKILGNTYIFHSILENRVKLENALFGAPNHPLILGLQEQNNIHLVRLLMIE
ncbi:hypothetical protein LguiA_002846 [Lonicera macranthoides]